MSEIYWNLILYFSVLAVKGTEGESTYFVLLDLFPCDCVELFI